MKGSLTRDKWVFPQAELLLNLFTTRIYKLDEFERNSNRIILLALQQEIPLQSNSPVMTDQLTYYVVILKTTTPNITHLYFAPPGEITSKCKNPAECSDVFPTTLQGSLEQVEPIDEEHYNLLRKWTGLPPLLFPDKVTILPKALWHTIQPDRNTRPTNKRGPPRPSYFGPGW